MLWCAVRLQIAFEKAGGLKLMISMVREKKYCQSAAMKVIDFAVSRTSLPPLRLTNSRWRCRCAALI